MSPNLLLTLLLLSAAVLPACGSDGVPRSDFACVYEERQTDCGGGSFGPWTSECSFVDFEIRDDLTPQAYCDQAYPASDTECGGGCCISFQFRNVVALSSCN